MDSFNNPKGFMHSLVGNLVTVKLLWNGRFRGVLSSVDDYNNLSLVDVMEYTAQGVVPVEAEEMMVRHNAVLYVAQDEEDDDDEIEKKPKVEEDESEEEVRELIISMNKEEFMIKEELESSTGSSNFSA